MTILQVLYFIEAARQGSMSRAADILYVSQPSLSYQIMKLEDELDTKLFKRNSHGIELTANGKIFLDKAAEIEGPWKELLKTSDQFRTAPMETLKIWLGPTIYSQGLSDQIIQFCDENIVADTSFASSFEAPDNLYNDIQSGKYDIAIDRLPPMYMMGDASLFHTSVLHEEVACVMVNRTHPLSKQTSITAKDLTPYRPIAFRESSSIDNIQKDIYHKLGIKGMDYELCSTISESMDKIRRGKCYAIGRHEIAHDNRLLSIPFEPKHYIPLHFVCLENRAQDPQIRSIFRYVKSLYRNESSL